MTETTHEADASSALLEAMLNMTAFHREHEKFYAVAPGEQAVTLQRHARTLHALVDTWSVATADRRTPFSPYEGANDLNAAAALQLDGVLFMEGGGTPTELTHLERELASAAEDAAAAGEWLAAAMQSAWDLAPALFAIDGLADLLGERHRIIANNWQAASVMTLAGRILDRAAELLGRIDFDPAALRADLDGPRLASQRVSSAAEMLDHSADLFSHFAGLVHDNERRWRVVRARVEAIVAADRTA